MGVGLIIFVFVMTLSYKHCRVGSPCLTLYYCNYVFISMVFYSDRGSVKSAGQKRKEFTSFRKVWDSVCSVETLTQAWILVHSGCGGAGQLSVNPKLRFRGEAWCNTEQVLSIQHLLINGNFQFTTGSTFEELVLGKSLELSLVKHNMFVGRGSFGARCSNKSFSHMVLLIKEKLESKVLGSYFVSAEFIVKVDFSDSNKVHSILSDKILYNPLLKLLSGAVNSSALTSTESFSVLQSVFLNIFSYDLESSPKSPGSFGGVCVSESFLYLRFHNKVFLCAADSNGSRSTGISEFKGVLKVLKAAGLCVSDYRCHRDVAFFNNLIFEVKKHGFGSGFRRVEISVCQKYINSSLQGAGFLKVKDNGLVEATFNKKLAHLGKGDITFYYNAVLLSIYNNFFFDTNCKESLEGVYLTMKYSYVLTMMKKNMNWSVSEVHISSSYANIVMSKCSLQVPVMPSFVCLSARSFFSFMSFEDVLLMEYSSKMTNSDLLGPCVICGASDGVDMHHTKPVGFLRAQLGQSAEKDAELVKQGIEMPQIPLCWKHHHAHHKGLLSKEEQVLYDAAVKKAEGL